MAAEDPGNPGSQTERPGPDASNDKGPDVDGLVERIRARVNERRKSGFYPEGLEEELSAHFQRIVDHRSGYLAPLRHRLNRLVETMGFDPRKIDTDSEVLGGKLVHQFAARLNARQTQGILEQVHLFARAVRDVLEGVIEVLEDPSNIQPEVVGQIDAILERLAAYERAPDESSVAVMELSRRVEELEAAEESRRFRPMFSKAKFEERFQGSAEDYPASYRSLAERLKDSSPVLDVGCGSGRFMMLLRELGVEASGVDPDPELVALARERGLAVERRDGLEHLDGLLDGSLGGAALIQVVEHLTPQQIVELAVLLARKLRAGGIAVVETTNPQSLYTFAHTYYLDPSHVQPVHPAYLSFLFREADFGEVDIEWRSPPPEGELLEESGEQERLGQAFDANVRRLNRLLFGPQNYALIATR